MAEYKGVMVVAEVTEDRLANISGELLGCARKLATELGEEVSAVLIGDRVDGLAKDLITMGADKVYVAQDAQLKDYQTDTYLTVMEKLVKQVSPRILLLGQTAIGRDLTPRLAFRLGTAATLDCVDLAINPETRLLLMTKPVYGGNARAVFTSELFPQIATIRQKAMSPLPPDPTRQGQIIPVAVSIDPAKVKTKYLGKVKEEVAGIKLEDAQIVVAGGRGMGGPEGFKQLEELARVLKAAVGASRPPCDNNWVPSTLQVGLTGKIVTPELYIAVGISGASQHLAGCSGAKTIVAINKDPEANIFKEARFGVVGDWKQVLPAFTAKVRELVAG
ncbi:MAG: electron transfer flavoprotein subunit alpha/FixB family protein [Dehalococcoidia bacterium]|nr:electron transfer flavoprotein subunit alpha/FixB family protein [Dehalococcoidia bacterium]